MTIKEFVMNVWECTDPCHYTVADAEQTLHALRSDDWKIDVPEGLTAEEFARRYNQLNKPLFWLDCSVGDLFILSSINDLDAPPVCCGSMSDIGVVENDPDWTTKMDEYFEKEYGILPNEWVMG